MKFKTTTVLTLLTGWGEDKEGTKKIVGYLIENKKVDIYDLRKSIVEYIINKYPKIDLNDDRAKSVFGFTWEEELVGLLGEEIEL